ncbi:tRNA (adenosine(37)-N6)-threonylcarbamoyltransferase complex ATPase subunit type 1 TsaE [Azospira sp. APE16]|jgi:tRNA threonylcarbamoyladenosine biosynthesis protein TsaE|uniref:tRNA (adenosine(37)-N6)-threonylcarbamoyltransferase complex ATPase subunit type 1 TsaE n=1 Tax=unclassified Azospira TaxID=2609269 RepID=UPI0012607605|nr:tRNA (adenosine(37)-N6)-threonylcarbamoyltransferase complex ATPase subunit type 1 TsaE [Azospira sp. I09]BBN88546.1 tRNA (adenosine(37)-N6)-threonylcarbamoyltransferase complex ATPase subunit type 1 TsaE [Azospira sp. I09]
MPDHSESAAQSLNPGQSLLLANEAATQALGAALAQAAGPGLVIYLEGDLGAGKTTLVRALLRALGHTGPVKSPTYALVEVYKLSSLYLYHFDFYRFESPEEFVDAGLDDYFRQGALCLVEWPDKAAGFVPPPDLVLAFRFRDDDGRDLLLQPHSPGGEQCVNALMSRLSSDAGPC